MCNTDCFSFVQFPDILPSDTHVSINGGNYPTSNTVDDLVSTNPQFIYAFGLSGLLTLHTWMNTGNGNDLQMTVYRDDTPQPPVTGVPAFVGPRPVVVR